MSPRWVFSSPESVDLDLISKITFQSDFDVSKISVSREEDTEEDEEDHQISRATYKITNP